MTNELLEGVNPSMPANYPRISDAYQERLIEQLLIHQQGEITDPYRVLLAEAYRHFWNQTVRDMVPRMNPGQLPAALVSLVRADVARTMREAVKSGKDPLTGMPNKMTLMHAADREIKRILREKGNGTKLLILYFDLDNFKNEVNDKLGHEAGDNVIIGACNILSGSKRDADIAGRFGGDELGMVLGNFDLKQIHLLEERFRDGLTKHDAIPGMPKINMSIGAAVYQQGETADPSELFHRAEIAMTHAKAIKYKRAKITFWNSEMEIIVRNTSR